MNNTIKTVIISSITCLIILLIVFIIIPFSIESIKQIGVQKTLSKYYGRYILEQGNIEDISQITEKLKSKKEEIEINENNIFLIDSIGNLAQDRFYVYKSQNKELIYGGLHMLATYEDEHTDLDIQLCFKLDGESLIQQKCTDVEKSHFNTDNVGLKYKKIN